MSSLHTFFPFWRIFPILSSFFASYEGAYLLYAIFLPVHLLAHILSLVSAWTQKKASLSISRLTIDPEDIHSTFTIFLIFPGIKVKSHFLDDAIFVLPFWLVLALRDLFGPYPIALEVTNPFDCALLTQ